MDDSERPSVIQPVVLQEVPSESERSSNDFNPGWFLRNTPDDSIICLDETDPADDLPNFIPYVPPFSPPPNIQSFSESEVSEASHSIEKPNEPDDDLIITYEKKATPGEVIFVEPRIKPLLKLRENNHGVKKHHIKRHQCCSCNLFRNGENISVGNENNSRAIISDNNMNVIDDDCVAISVIPPAKKMNVLDDLRQAAQDAIEKKRKKIECGVCFDGPDDISSNGRNLVSTVCGHVFCSECIKEAIKSIKHCPQCRKKLTARQYHPLYI